MYLYRLPLNQIIPVVCRNVSKLSLIWQWCFHFISSEFVVTRHVGSEPDGLRSKALVNLICINGLVIINTSRCVVVPSLILLISSFSSRNMLTLIFSKTTGPRFLLQPVQLWDQICRWLFMISSNSFLLIG